MTFFVWKSILQFFHSLERDIALIDSLRGHYKLSNNLRNYVYFSLNISTSCIVGEIEHHLCLHFSSHLLLFSLF